MVMLGGLDSFVCFFLFVCIFSLLHMDRHMELYILHTSCQHYLPLSSIWDKHIKKISEKTKKKKIHLNVWYVCFLSPGQVLTTT